MARKPPAMVEFIRASEYRRSAARLLAKKLVAAIDLADLITDPQAPDDLLAAIWEAVRREFLDDALADTLKANAEMGLVEADGEIIDQAVVHEIALVIERTLPYLRDQIEVVKKNVDRFTRPPAPAIDWSKAQTGVPIRGKVYIASNIDYRQTKPEKAK